jgi:two-component system chemotaxis response regulator CheV
VPQDNTTAPSILRAGGRQPGMSRELLDRIDQRIRLAGHNRLALLLFRLGTRQLFGVNVFKVQEVLTRPPLFRLPQLPRAFASAADVRGRTVPVLDLARAIGQEHDQGEPNYLVVTEFNRSVQGFLVSGVDRIVNIAVGDIQPPPDIGGECQYLTGMTRHHGELILLIDVESVLAEAAPRTSEAVPLEALPIVGSAPREVLVVDDSRVARNQIRGVLEQLGLVQSGQPPHERYAMVISDIEMPAMDGYTLTTEIRRNPALSKMFVLLHTSLSGVFNQAMVERVGADDFVPKYSERELGDRITARVAALA